MTEQEEMLAAFFLEARNSGCNMRAVMELHAHGSTFITGVMHAASTLIDDPAAKRIVLCCAAITLSVLAQDYNRENIPYS